MIILGIHDGHDASACLMRDGQVSLASAEERRRNKKNYSGAPTESIKEIFARTGIDPKSVDLVALGCKIRTTAPGGDKHQTNRMLRMFASAGRWHWSTKLGQKVLGRVDHTRRELYEFLQGMGITAPIEKFDHHQTHAATAYFHRPWSDDALVLTLDGAGDGLCATVSKGHGDKLEVIATTPKFHSIGAQLYSNITAHLGLKPYEHEYKVMGMAPYGQASYCKDNLAGMFSVQGLEFRNHTGRQHGALLDLMHKRLKRQRFDNIAAACQELFEELLVEWVRNAVNATGIHKVCAAGGAFLNVKANKLIREMPEVEDLYVYPASDDGGTSLGAAILGHLHQCEVTGKSIPLNLQKDMYLGLAYSPDECLEAIKQSEGIEYCKAENLAEQVAELLAERFIIGRFAGREEWGPRALGNRSILADPRDMGIIRKLNFAIKQRDFWMPFAASITEEDKDIYVKNCSKHAFYMIEAFDTHQPAGEQIVAGTHPFDKTVRPQVVNELNPEYREIIRAFKRRTGIGAVLNTSFNLHGFPIVGTPQVAIHTLLHSDLDVLALGPYFVWRSDKQIPLRSEREKSAQGRREPAMSA